MMGGDFGSQAGALLMIPVLLIVLTIGAGLGIGICSVVAMATGVLATP